MTEYIKVFIDEYKVMNIILNRPEVYNALNTGLMQELHDALIAGDSSQDVNCIVISGAGDSFCTGADIKEFGKQTGNVDAAQKRAELTKSVHKMISKLSKPVIASVHKYTLAGGCGIALACDIVIAADNTVFSYPEVIRGFVPAIVSPNLAKITGRKKAFELLITGDRITAEEANRLNLVNKIVPLSDLKSETEAFARKIAGYSQTAVSMTKKLFYEVVETPFDEAIEIAKDANVKMRQSDDFKRGVESFLKK